jgi:hypothetical protein
MRKLHILDEAGSVSKDEWDQAIAADKAKAKVLAAGQEALRLQDEWDQAIAMDKVKTQETMSPASYHVSENGMKVYFRGSCVLTIPVGRYLGLIEDLAIKLNNAASATPLLEPEVVMAWQQQKTIDAIEELVGQVEEAGDMDGTPLLDALHEIKLLAEAEA